MWPENETPVLVFAAMSTQWNFAGLGSPVGLRYESLPAVLRLLRIPKGRRHDVFGALRVMEIAALEDMRSGR